MNLGEGSVGAYHSTPCEYEFLGDAQGVQFVHSHHDQSWSGNLYLQSALHLLALNQGF